VAYSSSSQKSKRDTPSIATKEASFVIVGLMKKPSNEEKSVDKRSAKKFHFSPELEQVAMRSRIRASAKRLHVDLTLIQIVEISKSAHEGVETDENDQIIKGLQHQLGKEHLMITQFQRENTNLKRKVLQEIDKPNKEELSKKAFVPTVEDKGK